MNSSISIKRKSFASQMHRNYMENFKNIINVPSMTKEYKPKVAQQFDYYLTPEELKKYVLKSEKIQKLIDYYAKKEINDDGNLKRKRKEIEKKALEILEEIALQRNLPLIRWLGMCITQVSKRICSGIYVNEKNLEIVKTKLGHQPVLYLPSHRSYCDFILMSYICFHYDIEIPGIAAGMDFYSMVGMGNMLRKTGAFFMRRSFSNDEFYWDIFREYIYALVAVYHIGVEFFIEGTRSRNFKALVPKVGLLSMALKPLFMGDVPDVLIVPVSVSYERLLEEQLFVYELLGVPKPKESTKGFLKALKIIEERFGRMYLDFGEPISAKKFFGSKLDRIKHSNISAYLQKLDKNEITLVKDLANEIVYQQQRRIVITTFNLVTVYYAYKTYMGQKISLKQLCNGVLLLKTVFEHLDAHIATEEKTIKTDIIETIQIHSNILRIVPNSLIIELIKPNTQAQVIHSKKLKAYRLCDQVMQSAVASLSLQLYINPCMFWLSTPALTVLCAMKLSAESTDIDGCFHRDQLRLRVDELNSIFANEFVIISTKREEEFYKNLLFLVDFKIFEITDRIRFYKNDISEILLSSIAPFLCIYLQLTETILEQFQKIDFMEKELLIAVQKRVENLLLNRAQYIHSYCLAIDNLLIALQSLVQNEYLDKRKDETNCNNNSNNNNFLYSCRKKELLQLRNILLQYCSILPFHNFSLTINDSILAKL